MNNKKRLRRLNNKLLKKRGSRNLMKIKRGRIESFKSDWIKSSIGRNH